MATKPDNSSNFATTSGSTGAPKAKASARIKRRKFVRQEHNPANQSVIEDFESWKAKQSYFYNVTQKTDAITKNEAMNSTGTLDSKRQLEPLQYITIEPDTSEEAIRDKDVVNITCIWLHGLGADGNDLAQVPALFNFPEQFSFRHIFPHAPMRSVTANGGIEMRAWYDMRSLPPRYNDDIQHIEESTSQIIDLIDGDPNETRYYLIGFSQGGCMALNIAMSHGERIAGAIAMSCYFANKDILSELRPGYICPPVFLSHGKYDPVVPFDELTNTANLIRPYCSDLVLRRYRSGHNIESDTIRDINYWFNNRL